MMSKTIRWMAPLGLALAAACGSEGGSNNDDTNGNANGGGNNPPVINSFEISGLPIDSGDTVTLNWSVSGADSITIQQGGTDLGVTEFMGSRMSNEVSAPTVFRLTASNANGDVMQEQEVTANDINGIQILSFTSNQALVTSGEVITLTYEIAGVAMIDSVEIFDEDMSTLRDGQDVPIDPATLSMSSVAVRAVGNPDDAVDGIDTKTYTIRASGGGTSATATVNVDVEVADPVIELFEVSGPTNTFFFGDRPIYNFTARNADGYQLFFDDVPCTGINGFGETGAVINQNCSGGEVVNAEHTVTLKVFNTNRPLQTDPVEMDITVLGVAEPMINSFTVTPDDFWQGSVTTEISWDVSSDASFVRLEIRRPGQGATFAPVLGAPNSLQASNVLVEVQASNGTSATEFRLTALVTDDGTMDGTVLDGEQQRREISVQPSFNEPEGPNGNESPETANIIQANGLSVRGNLSTINDVDWFGFDVTEGQSLFAVAGAVTYDPLNLDIRCNLDTSLQLFDASGVAVSALQTENSGETVQELIDLLDPMPPAVDTECAELRAGRDAGLINLAAGRYYVAVSGASGNYQLVVDRFDDDGDPESFVPPAQSGLPVWDVVNVNISQITTRDGSPVVPVIATMQYLHPNHRLAPDIVSWFNNRFAMGGVFSGFFAPRRPHVVDYGNAVSPGLAFIGASTNQIQYPRAAIGAPGTDGDGFLLTYTVVPSTANTVNGTAEDYDLVTGNATGPIIPSAVLPLTTEVQLLETALPSVQTVWDENSPGGMDRDPQAYPGFQTTGTMYDGITHMHFAHVISRNFFNNMGDPLDIDPMVATYLLNWQIQILDAEGNGYDFQVPIRLQ